MSGLFRGWSPRFAEGDVVPVAAARQAPWPAAVTGIAPSAVLACGGLGMAGGLVPAADPAAGRAGDAVFPAGGLEDLPGAGVPGPSVTWSQAITPELDIGAAAIAPDSCGQVTRRSLAEVELEARYKGLLTDIDYLRLFGKLTAVEAVSRRRKARDFYESALADLRRWQELGGC